MTLIAQGEVVTIGEVRYNLGEEITATPEAILAIEGLQSSMVLVAQGLNEAGEIATMVKRAPPNPCPIYPTPDELRADPGAKAKYRQAYDEYLERKARQEPDKIVPIPPAVGYPRTVENSSYFHLDQIGTNTPHILPLETASRNRTTLYRFRLAEIVE
jgi:hypothetical protein